jgi:hypothetical protein
MIIELMIAGVFLNVLPLVLMLIVPAIVLVYAMVEIFAASAYSFSRNLALMAFGEFSLVGMAHSCGQSLHLYVLRYRRSGARPVSGEVDDHGPYFKTG